ncbi:MAG TPA: choice-of-anchor U domain-containing protein [Gammaproteobacteria bacterium]|nr:choice-of-anchor U domain-containing protein [Gammaproteobacteria bacterium]
MFSIRYIFLFLLLTISLASTPASAGILFSHSGDTDPINTGWVVNTPAISPGGRPASGGIPDDGGTGLAAWYIDDDLLTVGSSWFYEQTPSAAEINQGNTFGWTLRARVKVVDAPDDPASPGSIVIEYADGITSYSLSLGSLANGDPVAEFEGGASYTLQGGGNDYHLYEIVYDPSGGTVDLFIDGIERISDYSGIASAMFTRVIWGSASSGDTGQGNWNLVEWEVTPALAVSSLRMQTDLGGVDIQFFDNATPQTYTNFMNYVNDADYDGSFIHRSVPGFILQMGGFVFDPAVGNFFSGGQVPIPEDPPVVNEPGISNTRATIAMAKIPATDSNGNPIPGGGPDSATNQFFFNLVDNSGNLDTQNGGFTVFAQVSGKDMEIIDAIAALPRCIDQIALCQNNSETPIVGLTAAVPPLFFAGSVAPDNLVLIQGIGIDSDDDGIIDRMEDTAPNGGDGNNDLIIDRSQAGVASFRIFTGEHARLETLPPETLASTDILGPAFAFTTYNLSSIPAIIADYSFIYGYFGFELLGVAPGGATMVTLTLPPGTVANDYFSYGPSGSNPAPHWFSFLYDGETGAVFNGNIITLHYVDGKRGDADLIGTNGVIAAPGGPAINLNGDSDGIPDSIEDGAPNSGDGNSDGIPDKAQDNVGSLPDPGNNYLTVVADQSLAMNSYFFSTGTGILDKVTPPGLLDGLNFAHGFLSFRVINTPAGSSLDATLILPPGESPTRYFMYGPTPANPADHLYEFSYDGETGAEFSNNRVILHFVDGKRGDSDLSADGNIEASGAPALNAPISDSGGGSSGCTILANRKPAHFPGDWILLMLFMAALGITTIRRHSRITC